jgi:HEAT repeat protein
MSRAVTRVLRRAVQRANMKRTRRFGLLFLFALAVGLVGYAVWPREPVYEGRDLREWVGELVELANNDTSEDGSESARRAWDARHEKAVTAFRSIGVKALPQLLSWLRSAPGPTPLRDKLQDLLDEHTPWKLKLPERNDHTAQAVAGFRALGSTAEPALPELRRLLHKPATWEGAVFSLGAIGPAAVPILASELANSNCPAPSCVVDVLVELAPSVGPSLVSILADGVTNPSCHAHAECLAGLGNLGPVARELAPWLSALARKPGDPLAGQAMRVLAEVSDRPEQYLPLFSDRLNNTNLARHVAFALGRIGTKGIPALLRVLTNQEPDIKAAALAALDPKLRDRHPNNDATPPARRFSVLCFDFDRIFVAWSRKGPATLRTPVLEEFLASQRLGGALDHPDPAIRLEIVRMLVPHGHDSAIGLSRAVADIDDRVRAEAQAALVEAGIEVREGGIIRGPTGKKRIALIFAGNEYAENGETILNELARHTTESLI